MKYEDNIFNRDFYPTPVEVIEQMLSLTDVRGRHVLEPSAGSGNIVDFVKERGAASVCACEVNTKLRTILEKKCELIGSDFLKVTAEQISHIDLIVMNPPFSNEEEHILHAYEIAPEGCEIISLCNSNVVSMHYTTKQQQVCELIRDYGSSQYLGEVFSNSDERSTDCKISCIRLYKPKSRAHEFDDIFDMNDDDYSVWQTSGGVVRYDYVQDIVSRYKDALDMFDSVQEANAKINELCKGIGSQTIVFGAHKHTGNSYEDNLPVSRDIFRKQLQKDAWRGIFNKLNMQKYVTKGVMADLNRAIELMQNMPFSVRNVYRLIQQIVLTHGERMNSVLIETFDKICSFSADNSSAGEKWKTNSDYMINKRFIVPYMVSDSKWYNHVSLNYSGNADSIEDLCKALCYIKGIDYNTIGSLRVFLNNNYPCYGTWFEWAFFRVRGYKKGTMHFEFLDEDLWYKFNQAVASVKGWQLPKQHKVKKKK